MFEARLIQGIILKKITEAIKDLITETNIDCSSTGMSLQAMDSAHVALVSLLLRSEAFSPYRVDRNLSLGITFDAIYKVLKCAGNEDMITLKTEDAGDELSLMFESPGLTRMAHFTLKLMDIDSEHLGIPDTDYKCVVTMPSEEFQRICREMEIMGDTVSISANKAGVKFSVKGEIGTGSIVCKANIPTEEEEKDQCVTIKLEEEVELSFALRYLKAFCKATPLSSLVTLKMSPETPLVVEYNIHNSDGTEVAYLQYYLAPKITEDAPKSP